MTRARFTAELAFAHHLADLADDVTLPAFRTGPTPQRKADGTWVTAADQAVETLIRDRIAARFPDHAVLGEEDGLHGDADAPRWIVDPIDGTTNFVAGNPIFATLIALQHDGEDVLGVVSAPALGSRWDGAVGHGARRDGRPIAVSTTDRLADAEVAFGGLGYFAGHGHGDLVARLTAVTRRQRGYGDFWQHCLVAGGSTDVAIEAEVNVWDLAAVRAVVEGAGGRFTDLDGNATSAGGSALSTNGRLHDAVLTVVHAR